MRIGNLKNWMRSWGFKILIGLVTAWMCPAASATGVDPVTATVQANRLNGIIAGGAIPFNDPVFVKMVSDVQAGNYAQAATDAVNSTYFPYYLPRRMAKEMMNPQMNESGIPDNDSVAFIVANMLGLAGTQPSIANIWTQNATYCVNTTTPNVNPTTSQAVANGACGANQVHMFYAGDPLAFDWTAALVKVSMQTATDVTEKTQLVLAQKDVGGYMTLTDAQGNGLSPNYNDFSQFAFSAGTNLRAV
jgi:hypothetical protein